MLYSLSLEFSFSTCCSTFSKIKTLVKIKTLKHLYMYIIRMGYTVPFFLNHTVSLQGRSLFLSSLSLLLDPMSLPSPATQHSIPIIQLTSQFLSPLSSFNFAQQINSRSQPQQKPHSWLGYNLSLFLTLHFLRLQDTIAVPYVH